MQTFKFIVTQTDVYRKEIEIQAPNARDAEKELEIQLEDSQFEIQGDTFISSSKDWELKKD